MRSYLQVSNKITTLKNCFIEMNSDKYELAEFLIFSFNDFGHFTRAKTSLLAMTTPNCETFVFQNIEVGVFSKNKFLDYEQFLNVQPKMQCV